MHRYFIATALCLATLPAANVSADHYRELRRTHEAHKAEFTRAYHAQRRELRHAFQRSHEALIAERRFISRIDCHETRSRRLRVNSRELAELAREHGRQNRALSQSYRDGLRTLEDDYEFARSRLRANRTPVFVQSHAHPANCTCEMCIPPTLPPAQVHRYDHDRYREPFHARRTQYRKTNGLDIAVAILGLLN